MAMEQDQPLTGYAVRLDERRERWYLRLPAGERLTLERASLCHLVSLYNEIHRGNPLTLIERRTLHELGRERDSLQETIRNLYDFIDAEPEAAWSGAPAPPATAGPGEREAQPHPRPAWLARLAARIGLR
jgi:hypothetical protein